MSIPDDAARPELPEQLDRASDDAGGMPYDDDLGADDEARRTRGAGPAYDSASSLIDRNIAFPDEAPAGMRELRSYVRSRWGGADLGILAKPPRAVRAGDTPSLHNWGMAWDWRWQDPGPGRRVADDVIQFCLTNAPVLGIQAVHDYEGTRYWKVHAGWRTGTPNPSTGMGQPWAQWLHIERTWQAANLETAIDALLGGGDATIHATAKHALTSPDDAGDQRPPVLPDGPLQRGSVGADVGRLQDFLRMFGFADFSRSDGVFGPRTETAVIKAQQAMAIQSFYTAEIDGIWGPKTNAAAALLLAGLAR